MYLKIIKYINCIGKNNQTGKGITKYAGMIREEQIPHTNRKTKIIQWIKKQQAIELIQNIPLEIDNMEMQL